MVPAIILFAATYVLMIPVIAGIGILRKEGHDVTNGDFFKIGIPFTLSAIVPAYILIWILFG